MSSLSSTVVEKVNGSTSFEKVNGTTGVHLVITGSCSGVGVNLYGSVSSKLTTTFAGCGQGCGYTGSGIGCGHGWG